MASEKLCKKAISRLETPLPSMPFRQLGCPTQQANPANAEEAIAVIVAPACPTQNKRDPLCIKTSRRLAHLGLVT